MPRRPLHVRQLLAPALFALASAGAVCQPAPPQLDREFTFNGGFETGDLSNWTVTGSCEVHDATSPWADPAVGNYFLYGGDDANASTCTVTQEVILPNKGLGSDYLAANPLLVDASAYLRDFSGPTSYDDQSFLRVRYLNALGQEVSSIRTLIGGNNSWGQEFAMGLLPPETYKLSIEVEARFRAGADNDAMADEVSTMVRAATPAIPTLTKPPLLQDFRQDAMTVLWETNGNLERPAIEWGPAGGALSNVLSKVESTEVTPSHYVHKATITGLTAETEYDYRVRMGTQTYTTYRFRTAPLATSPYRVAWTSDNQNGPGTFTNVVGLMASRNPDLYISPGDIVQNGDTLSEWGNYWWTPLSNADFGQTTPVLFARGNHDGEHAYSYAYSALPENESFYSFTYGNAFIVVLDTEASPGSTSPEQDQEAYLQAALGSPEAAAAEFRIVTFHKPPYTNLWDATNILFCLFGGSGYTGETSVRTNWVPLFEFFDVDLVVSGHTHSYQHGEQNGVHYVLVGGAGGSLDTFCGGDWPLFDFEASSHGYSLMDVNGTNLTWTSYDDNDVTIHSFSINH